MACNNRARLLSDSGMPEHLRFPCVGGQRPAVAEDDRLTRSPILVVNLFPSFVVIVLMVFVVRCYPRSTGPDLPLASKRRFYWLPVFLLAAAQAEPLFQLDY